MWGKSQQRPLSDCPAQSLDTVSHPLHSILPMAMPTHNGSPESRHQWPPLRSCPAQLPRRRLPVPSPRMGKAGRKPDQGPHRGLRGGAGSYGAGVDQAQPLSTWPHFITHTSTAQELTCTHTHSGR